MVCSSCFADTDLRRFIREQEGPRGCSYCRRKDAPTANVSDAAEYIKQRLSTFYGMAVEQLPYESAEGGYLGWHTSTYELLFYTVGLELPRDRDDTLAQDLVSEIGDDVWCEYDWLSLDLHESLRHYWDRFCRTIKHQRRFFFSPRDDQEYAQNPDDRSLAYFLTEIGKLADELGLIKEYPPGYKLYRARPRPAGKRYKSPSELGPPPSERATQSNRMNPPGIPMFYGAERKALACAEVGATLLSVGLFTTERNIQLLDLATLPKVPGFFADATREETLGLSFLRDFSKQISQPVPRDDRSHIEYTPTQVFTEFLRDFPFVGGPIDGLRYPTATTQRGANVVLFADQNDLIDGTREEGVREREPWLRLHSSTHIELSSPA